MQEETVLSNHSQRTAVDEFWRRYKRNKLAVVGLAIFTLICLCAIFAPWITWHPPLTTDLGPALIPPTSNFPFGTDDLARDIYSNVIYGARTSLFVGLVSVIFSTSIGILVGAVAGYYGGRIDDLLMRTTDIFLIIPSFFLALVIVSIIGQTIYNVVIAIAITTWTSSARLLRAEFLSFKEREFVDAAKVIGESDRLIIFNEILPNAIFPVTVNTALQIATAILIEAGLSFLGVGDPNIASWGRMLNEAQSFLINAPWMAIFPGLALFLATLSVNLIADGLNDVLNPKVKARR
jgi:peptide/nickel transport system permease protein